VTARCGSCRLTLQRLAASSRRSHAVTCGRPGSREVGVSFRGSWCPSSSALVALRAPPSPFETASGSFSTDLTPATKAREILSWSSLPLQSRTASRLPVPRVCLGPLTRTWAPDQVTGIASRGFLAPSSATTPGAPVAAGRIELAWRSFRPSAFAPEPRCGGWRSPCPHRCRPQGSCPSRRFLAALAARTDPLRDPPSP